MVREKELQLFKDINNLRQKTDPDSVYFVLNSASQKVNQIWVTNNKNIPKKVELSGVISAQDLISIQSGNQIRLSTIDGKLQVNPIVSPNSSLDVSITSTQLQLQLSATLLTKINDALQVGDNISDLINDAGYITNADLPNATSIKREEFEYIGSQIFTLSNDYYQVFSVEVQGQGSLSLSQYNLIAPNQVEILDTLNINDYLVILYGEDLQTTAIPYYTQAQIDVLVVAQNRIFNEVPYGNMDGINATFTSEFNFIPETLAVFLNGILQKIISDYNTSGNTVINLVNAPASIENLVINYTKQP
jgi:hypothetical protein